MRYEDEHRPSDDHFIKDVTDAGRLKDRSDMFKMKGRKIDFATETYQKSKEARQNHIDAIRKLQHVKNKLSLSKPSRDDGAELYDISSSPGNHASGNDPSSEMTFIFGAQENCQHKSHTDHNDVNSERGSSSNFPEPISLNALSGLLDSKLQPLHSSISGLENKFSELSMRVEHEIVERQGRAEKERKEQNERSSIIDSNVDNLHSQVQGLQMPTEKTEDKVIACETAILNIKNFLAAGDAASLQKSSGAKSPDI